MTEVTIINHIEVKPGKIDEFLGLQQAFAAKLSDKPSGLVGGRMYRSADGLSAVLISQFESAEAQARILQSDAFQQHIGRLRELIVSSSPKFYEAAYTTGAFQ